MAKKSRTGKKKETLVWASGDSKRDKRKCAHRARDHGFKEQRS